MPRPLGKLDIMNKMFNYVARIKNEIDEMFTKTAHLLHFS